MKPYQLIAASALALIVLAGCTTTGLGRGEMTAKDKPAEPVLFSWKSTDGGMSGTMVATLPDATYTGKFLQITRQTQRETLAPMWNGWNEGWNDWPYWTQPYPAPYDATQFITYYSGKVVANLETNGPPTTMGPIPGMKKNAEPKRNPHNPPQKAPNFPQYLTRSPVL